MKVISIDKGEQADKENEIKTKPSGVPRSNDPAVVRPHEDHEKHNPLVMNGTTSGGSVRERKGSKPPVPSRAPTTSLSRPKSSRSSVAGKWRIFCNKSCQLVHGFCFVKK